MLQNCSYVSIVISSVYFLLVCYLLARFYALETFLSNVIEAVLTGGNDVNCRGTHIPSGWSPGRLLLFFFFFLRWRQILSEHLWQYFFVHTKFIILHAPN